MAITLFFIMTQIFSHTLLYAEDDLILVPESAGKRVLVPKSEVSSDWNSNLDFDDSSWQLCTGSPGGIGYEKNSGYEDLITLDVLNDMHNDGDNPNNGCFIRIKFNVTSSDISYAKYLTLSMSLDDVNEP